MKIKGVLGYAGLFIVFFVSPFAFNALGRPLDLQIKSALPTALVEMGLWSPWLQFCLFALCGVGGVLLYRGLMSINPSRPSRLKVFYRFSILVWAASVLFLIYQLIYYRMSKWYILSYPEAIFYVLLYLAWGLSLSPLLRIINTGSITFTKRVLCVIIVLCFLVLTLPVVMAGTWAWDYGGIPRPFPYGPFLPPHP